MKNEKYIHLQIKNSYVYKNEKNDRCVRHQKWTNLCGQTLRAIKKTYFIEQQIEKFSIELLTYSAFQNFYK